MKRRVVFLLAGVFLAAAGAQETAAPPPNVPHRSDIELKRETETIDGRVPRNATLDGILRQEALAEPFVLAAIKAARAVFNPRQLHSDRPYRLVRSVDGMLQEFVYQIDADRFLRIMARDRSRPASLDA